jgi:hypothetical protein
VFEFPNFAEPRAEVDHLLLRHKYFAAATVDGVSGFNDYPLRTAIRIRMLLHFQAAYHTPSVKELVMPAVFSQKESLLVGKVAFNKELAIEVVIARHQRNAAFDAFLGLDRFVFFATTHSDTSYERQ